MSASREETIVDPEWENFFREKGQRQRTLRHLLGEMPVFSLLRADELKWLARIVHVRRFKTGEVVIRRGTQQSGFYVVREGAVNVVRSHADGTQQVMGTLYPPELIGEFALLDDHPRSTSIVAAEPSELIGFFKPDLMDIMVTRPAMGCAILLRLAEQMSATLIKDYKELQSLGYPFPDQLGEERMDPTTS
jgi:CRP/FNR family cyclic AMP-dependent transcriptional regulator